MSISTTSHSRTVINKRPLDVLMSLPAYFYPNFEFNQIQETEIIGGDRYSFSNNGLSVFVIEITGASGSWNIIVKTSVFAFASPTDTISPNGSDYLIWS